MLLPNERHFCTVPGTTMGGRVIGRFLKNILVLYITAPSNADELMEFKVKGKFRIVLFMLSSE